MKIEERCSRKRCLDCEDSGATCRFINKRIEGKVYCSIDRSREYLTKGHMECDIHLRLRNAELLIKDLQQELEDHEDGTIREEIEYLENEKRESEKRLQAMDRELLQLQRTCNRQIRRIYLLEHRINIEKDEDMRGAINELKKSIDGFIEPFEDTCDEEEIEILITVLGEEIQKHLKNKNRKSS